MEQKKYILSDPQALKQIKLYQYIWQGISVVIMAIGFILGMLTRMNTLSSVIVGFGVGVFLISGMAHRYKNKIPVPDADMFVSPIQGRLRYARQNEEVTVINITRIFLDTPELRSPHPKACIEGETLKVNTEAGDIEFRFNNLKVEWLPEPNFERGNVIGTVKGHGSCTISIPTAAFNAQVKDAAQQLTIPKVGRAVDICENLFEWKD
ncbi:MAG: hypothetical protein ACOYIS_02940 [Candidatus Cloacimonadaceae bacterium]|jgi:hypothetical protein